MPVRPAKRLMPIDGIVENPHDPNPNQVYFDNGQFVVDTGRGLDVRGGFTATGGGISNARDAGGQVYNVLAYGASMNSPGTASANRYAANLASSTALAASGGIVFFPPGVLYVNGPVTYYKSSYFQGAGPYTSILMTASGSPSGSDVLQSSTFSQNTLTVQNDGDHDVVLDSFGVDGNGSFNLNGGNGISHYGAHPIWRNLMVRECNGAGIWSEYNPATGQTPYALGLGKASMEGQWENIEVFNCRTNGARCVAPSANVYADEGFTGSVFAQVMFLGPHDSKVRDLLIHQGRSVLANQRGLLMGKTGLAGGVANSVTGTEIVNLIAYLNHNIAVDLNTGYCHIENAHIEGANINILHRAGPQRIAGYSFTTFSGGEAIRFAGGNQSQIKLTTVDMGQGGAHVNFKSGPSWSDVFVTAFQNTASAFLYTGSVPPTSRVYVLNANGSQGLLTGLAVRQNGSG